MPVFAQRRVPLNRRKKVPERRVGIFAVLENQNAQSHKSMAKYLNKQHCFVTNQLTTAWKRSACIKLSYFSKTHVTNVKIYIATRTKNSYPCYAAANTKEPYLVPRETIYPVIAFGTLCSGTAGFSS